MLSLEEKRQPVLHKCREFLEVMGAVFHIMLVLSILLIIVIIYIEL